MNPQLNHELVRARQQEIAFRTIRAEHASEMLLISGPRRTARQRISKAVAVLGARLAVSSPPRSAAQPETPAP